MLYYPEAYHTQDQYVTPPQWSASPTDITASTTSTTSTTSTASTASTTTREYMRQEPFDSALQSHPPSHPHSRFHQHVPRQSNPHRQDAYFYRNLNRLISGTKISTPISDTSRHFKISIHRTLKFSVYELSEIC